MSVPMIDQLRVQRQALLEELIPLLGLRSQGGQVTPPGTVVRIYEIQEAMRELDMKLRFVSVASPVVVCVGCPQCTLGFKLVSNTDNVLLSEDGIRLVYDVRCAWCNRHLLAGLALEIVEDCRDMRVSTEKLQ